MNTTVTPPAATSPADFRSAMSLLAAAVNIVTTDGPAGRAGMTATAVCSVSDQPPTVLVCVNRAAQTHPVLVDNGVLCVNVLTTSQQGLANLFGSRVGNEERFAAAQWQTLATGAPALDGALVNLDAQIVQRHEVGTHSVFIAEVRQIRVTDKADASPPVGGLVYFNRAYHSLIGDSV
jgi:flavin reductase